MDTIDHQLISHMNNVLSGDQQFLMDSSNYIEKTLLIPKNVLQFLNVLVNAENAQLRSLSAVLLRNSIINNFIQFDAETVHVLKVQLLEMLLRNDLWIVVKGICHVVIILGQLILTDANSSWGELLPSLYALLQNDNNVQIRAALNIFQHLTENNGDELRGEFDNLKNIYSALLIQHTDPKIRVSAIQGEINIMQWLSVFTQIEQHAAIIPDIIGAISDFVKNGDDDETIAAFVAISDLAESPIPVLNQHIDLVLSLSVEVCNAQSVSEHVRVEALTLVMWIVKHKHKSIGKGEKLEILVKTALTCSAEPEDNPYDNDEMTVHKYAINLLEDLGRYISSEITYQMCSNYFTEFMQSDNPNYHIAVLAALLKLCPLWEVYILDDLDLIMQYVKFGLSSPNPILRMTACVAIGRLSDHLQPDITNYHNDIMPLIYNSIGDESLSIKEKALYALVSYVEYMGDKLLPYVDGLMELLVQLINIQSVDIQEMVLSAISAVAISSKSNIDRYVNSILEITHQLMSITDPNYLILKGRAIELVGNIGLSVGTSFAQHLDFYMNTAISCLSNPEYSQIHEDCFGFIANASEVLKSGIKPYLEAIIPVVLSTCSIEYVDEHSASAVVEEKKQAIHTLSVLALALGNEFIPYLPTSMEVALPLIDDRIDVVRKSAVTLSQSFILIAQNAFPHPGGKPRNGVMGAQQPLSDEVQTFVDALFPIYIMIMKEDESCEVVSAVCETLVTILGKLGTSALDKHMLELKEALLGLLLKKAVCNFPMEDDSSDEFGSEFYQIEEEELSVMIESCAVVSMLARLYGELFVPFFDIIEALDEYYMNPETFISYRYEASGCIAEVVEYVDAPLRPKVDYLYSIVKKGLSDSFKNIHNNAAYLAGVLCQNFPEEMQKYCQEILTGIYHLFEEKEELMIRDNAASCVAKMMMSFPEAFPFDEVLPVFMSVLPLAVDMNENHAVYGALIFCLQSQIPQIVNYIPAILSLFSQLIGNEEIQEDIQEEMAGTIRYLITSFPNLQQTEGLTRRQQEVITRCLN